MRNFFKDFAYIRKKRNRTMVQSTVAVATVDPFLWTVINWVSLKTLENVPLRNELFKMILSGLHRIPDTCLRSFVSSFVIVCILKELLLGLVSYF